MTKTGRIKCIPEFIRKNNLDFVGLSKKNKKATGHNRGILDGFKNQAFDVINLQYLKYCAISTVKNLSDNLVWRLVVVYGSPYEEDKLEFINDYGKLARPYYA
jgi:hypothetical protein